MVNYTQIISKDLYHTAKVLIPILQTKHFVFF